MQALRSFLVIEKGRSKIVLLQLGALAALVGLLEVAALAMVAPAIGILSNVKAFPQIGPAAWLGTYFANIAWQDALLLVIALLFALYLGKAMVQILYYRQQTKLVARWQSELANKLMHSYMNAPYQTHFQRNSAELIRNLTTLIQPFYVDFLNAALGLAVDLSAAVALVCLLLVIAPVPALAAGTLLIVIYTIQHQIFQRIHARLGGENAELMRKEQQSLQQSFGAFKELRVLRSDTYFVNQFILLSGRLRDNVARFEFSRRLPLIFGEIAMIFCVSAAILAMVFLVSDPTRFIVSVGVLAAAAFRLSPLANRIVGATGTISRAQPALALLAKEVEAGRLTTNAPPPKVIPLSNAIELQDVSYRYPGRDSDALRSINLTINRSEMIGVVGPSGSGKTTMVDVLLGLLSPSKGAVLVDGNRLKPDERLLAGYVPQEIFIFDDSLRRNIALGVPDDEIDDNRIRHVLNLVVLESFVGSLPLGLDTPLGERGNALSGGQRQRVAIARALYAAPTFLVMDEATSALDSETEQALTETVLGLRTHTSILVIAHRLSTVMMCDRLVMMLDGNIVDQGTFAELRDRNAQFRQMIELATRPQRDYRRAVSEEMQGAIF